MEAATLCLLLLALTCLATLLARFVRLPLPFVQVGVGVLAALPPFSVRATLDPHTFLLLFIPPLLFGDGWRLSRRELVASRWPVLGLAVGLVLLTVLAGGYGLHWLVPSMPLTVGFAVAALVSPTDAVAVSAITEHVPVPRRMMHVLESEALLNDASGLVAMRVAVAATLSGSFVPWHAAATFVLVGAGGLAIGWLLMLGYARLHRLLLVRAEDAALQTVVSALLPFAAYALAEQVGASGILAAVAAGIAASQVSLLEGAHFTARLQTGATWRVVGFCLNGIIFVLLGMQLPGIVGAGPVGIDLIRSANTVEVLGDIAALLALLVALRLGWVLMSVGLERLFGEPGRAPGWRVVAASSLAGVRGAVTLAGVLSLPLLMPDGTPFPSRDLAVTLATGVILGSMLIAAVGLPLLLRGHPDDGPDVHAEDRRARVAAAEAAILAVGEDAGPRGAALGLQYRDRLAALNSGPAEDEAAWRELHHRALHAERDAIQRLRLAGDVDDAVARHILAELDLLEAAQVHRPAR